MSDEEDRRSKSAQLSRAIEDHLAAAGETDMLGDWIVIASTVTVDRQGDPVARYHMAFSGGSMLDHHALGLLAKADELLSDGTMREEEG